MTITRTHKCNRHEAICTTDASWLGNMTWFNKFMKYLKQSRKQWEAILFLPK